MRADSSTRDGAGHGFAAPVGTNPLGIDAGNALLRSGGYGLYLIRRSGRTYLAGEGAGTGISLGSEPTWSDLYRTLVRLRRTRRHDDRGWLDHLARSLHGRLPGGTHPRTPAAEEERVPTPEWSRFVATVQADPLLRMHCATRRAAMTLPASESVSRPTPPHPAHPGGTFAVGVLELVTPAPGLDGGLLHQVLQHRFEHREDELAYFLEHFIRPPLRAFRLALDNHHTALLALHGPGIGFELSPELQATGRIVVTEHVDVRDAGRLGATDIREGVRALVRTLDMLGAGFRGSDEVPGRAVGGYSQGEVRAGVDRVVAEELRYLEAHTADVLSGEHPLQCFVHTVPDEQDDALKRVLRTVQERTRIRRWEPHRPKPTVMIDLDLCAIVPLQRTLDAARAISGPREGAPDGIAELAHPEALCVLPTYSGSTWRNFVEACGLAAKYPGVNWQRVHAEFFRVFARSGEQLRTDTVNAGLARFVWDVHDAGGRVVFGTSRRRRVREYTREVLDTAGVPDTELLFLPDDRVRPISELKVEQLRELGEIDLVAAFDDMLANRIAITKEFSGALAVAVEIPGMATERRSEQPVADAAPVIATFETSPRPRTGSALSARGPTLSHTHSLEEVQVSALRTNRVAQRWAAQLTMKESLAIVESVVSDADRAAERAARSAHAKFATADPERSAHAEQRDRTVRQLHHLFTRKQFLKGSRSNYRLEDMRRDAVPFLERGSPIEVVLLGFPIKQSLNRLKASGPLPDLAELGALVRLRELQHAVRFVYPPGLHFNILTDGRHFRPRPLSATGAYGRKLRQYLELAGMDGCASIAEIDEVARQRRGPGLMRERRVLFVRHRRLLEDMLRGFDITDEPLRTLDTITELASSVDGPDAAVLARSLGMLREMLMSMVYSVPVPVPGNADRLAWSRLVYADVYNLTDGGVSPEVRQARAAVLRRAWHNVIRYLATLRTDEALGYDDLFGDRVRLTVSAAMRGRCGFTYLGGSGLLPWQGTGVLDQRGYVAVDFAVSLVDQGFVPVYSPLLGSRQPWMMVPAQYTRPRAHGECAGGTRLDGDFAARARLRRR
ncbi:pyoverdine/dityrosine biosynthesis protein [Halopolyspora algeriensis]|uniref:Pyoverdine/dityrosine biosynthesis protein n=1 Tax=Halopolyspora algeriensis TaxID=1500506 RepID=A0A368VZ31_9ACTN|nr:L-tyrosine/L-tryptophan isonitrile synthase family protein [Halopolyspora algeriensis]RCW47267.1 pyoverdine/dityrosine biosynthesis protein [Halopolyspora algeriensis]TQM42503.1 pyoverdine/dityrosine biosynthesis protein [Halopolyspora algeriensis]